MKNSEKLGYSNIQNSVANTYQVPTEIVNLPSKGKLYPQDHSLRDVESVEIKFMTTREEDLLISPSLNEKGVAIDRVIESLVISHRVNASTMIAGDKNAILMAARKSAYGAEYEFELTCPSCMTNNTINASLDEVEAKEIIEDETAKYSEGNMLITLPKSGAVVELRILSTDDERIIEETTKKRLKNNLPAEELLTRYRRMFVSINGSTDATVINNFINNLLGIADSRFLRKKYLDLAPDVSFTYSSKCSNCGELLEGGVPIGVDFFWPKL